MRETMAVTSTEAAARIANIGDALARVRGQIADAQVRYGRAPGSVQLLAVSKTRSAQAVAAAVRAGQLSFGENQLQDAQVKLDALASGRLGGNGLSGQSLDWHFIGPLQSNKTRRVAEQFAWVHSIDRERVARRLSEQRPTALPPLNICIQYNVSNQTAKAGVSYDELAPLAHKTTALPNLKLRGIMVIPAPATDFDTQRKAFAQVREAFDRLRSDGIAMDTLSMGMSGDLEAAIAEGATIVRIGTAIFGPRMEGPQMRSPRPGESSIPGS